MKVSRPRWSALVRTGAATSLLLSAYLPAVTASASPVTATAAPASAAVTSAAVTSAAVTATATPASATVTSAAVTSAPVTGSAAPGTQLTYAPQSVTHQTPQSKTTPAKTNTTTPAKTNTNVAIDPPHATSVHATSVSPALVPNVAGQSPAPQPGMDISSHGGPVMTNPTVYTVFWLPSGTHYESPGSAPTDTTYESLINRFFGDVGNNAYHRVVNQYGGIDNTQTSLLGGSYTDTTTYPESPLSDGDVQAAATRAASHFGVTPGINTLFMVYTGFGIEECFSATECNFANGGVEANFAFCAYHDDFNSGNTLYAFLGDDSSEVDSSGSCLTGRAPNGDSAADSEINTMSHELNEALTDPDLNAWFNTAMGLNGEVADLCNFNLAPVNSIGADVYLNGHPYAIQQTWSNAVHGCAMDLNVAENDPVIPGDTYAVNGPANAVTGQPIAYSIPVTDGNDTASSTLTTVTDSLPAGVTYVSGSANPAPTSTSPLMWSLGTIAVHNTNSITFDVTSNAQPVINCASLDYFDEIQIQEVSAVNAQCLTTNVAKAVTTTAVMSSQNPSVFGQPITLSATVSVNSPGSGIPTGFVQFFDGATSLGAGTLNGSSPPATSISVTGLSVGAHAFTAFYGGDPNFASSTSSILNQVVNKDPTTTVVTSNANPSVFGQPVTLTATVSANAPGAGMPTGMVRFFDGATALGTSPLNASNPPTVTLTTNALSVGTHPITATYGGDGDFLTSTSAVLNQVVNKAPTSTALAANPAGMVGFGHAVTFTATVSVPPPGAGSPTGPVAFSVDGTTVSAVNLNASEQASVTTSSLSPGTHVIGAAYQGDSNFASSSATINYLVTCTVNITGSHPGALVASGDSTCVVNATVGGAIVVPAGTSLAVINSTVNGSINAPAGANAIKVCGDNFVGGAVDVVNAQGLVIVGDPGDAVCAPNTMGGTLILTNNTHGVEAINNVVGGLIASGNSGPGPFPGDTTTISGNIIKH